MGGVYASEVPVGALAAQTLDNVRRQFETLFRDDAVKSAFTFLVKLAHACRSEDPHGELRASGIPISDKATLISIVRSLKDQIPQDQAATDSDGAFLFLGQAECGCAEDRHMDWK
jgi:hypothetical protein